jgi:hypothetical protein
MGESSRIACRPDRTPSAENEQGIYVDGFKPVGGNQQQQPKKPGKGDESGGTGATLLVGGLLLIFAVVVVGLIYLVFTS